MSIDSKIELGKVSWLKLELLATNDLYDYDIYESNFPKLMEVLNNAKDVVENEIKTTKQEIETTSQTLESKRSYLNRSIKECRYQQV